MEVHLPAEVSAEQILRTWHFYNTPHPNPLHAINIPNVALLRFSYLCPDGATARDLQDFLPGQTQRQEAPVAIDIRSLCLKS